MKRKPDPNRPHTGWVRGRTIIFTPKVRLPVQTEREMREEEELKRQDNLRLDREEELKRRWNMKGIVYDVAGGRRRLQVYIPNSLYAEVARVAGPRGLTDFVARALVEYVGQRKEAYKKG